MKRLKQFFHSVFRWRRRPADDPASNDPALTEAPEVPAPDAPLDTPEAPTDVPVIDVAVPNFEVRENEAPEDKDLEAEDAAGPFPVAPVGQRDPRIDAEVARDVLDVGDLLENTEIRLRLAEALAALPDVEVLTPEQGQPFDQRRHRWVETQSTADPDVVNTISHVISAGLADCHGRVLRAARVAVFDLKED